MLGDTRRPTFTTSVTTLHLPTFCFQYIILQTRVTTLYVYTCLHFVCAKLLHVVQYCTLYCSGSNAGRQSPAHLRSTPAHAFTTFYILSVLRHNFWFLRKFIFIWFCVQQGLVIFHWTISHLFQFNVQCAVFVCLFTFCLFVDLCACLCVCLFFFSFSWTDTDFWSWLFVMYFGEWGAEWKC